MTFDATDKAEIDSTPDHWTRLHGGVKASANLQRGLNEYFPQVFGYYGLSLGPLAQTMSVDKSPIRHWFNLSADLKTQADVYGHYHALPIASDTIDLVFMPHLLEFVHQPHQVLREVERVIIPEGKVIISGINPLSWYGAQRLGCRLMRKPCREKRIIGLSRIKDWLMLLGFSFECYFSLETSRQFVDSSTGQQWRNSFASHFTNHYLIIAKKKVSTLTPLRPSWKDNRKLVPARFAEPSVRQLVERELKKAQH